MTVGGCQPRWLCLLAPGFSLSLGTPTALDAPTLNREWPTMGPWLIAYLLADAPTGAEFRRLALQQTLLPSRAVEIHKMQDPWMVHSGRSPPFF